MHEGPRRDCTKLQRDKHAPSTNAPFRFLRPVKPDRVNSRWGRKLLQQPEGNPWRLRSGAPIGQRQPAASAYTATQHMITANTAGLQNHFGSRGEGADEFIPKNLIQLLFYDQLNKDEVHGDRNYNKNKEKMSQCLMKLRAPSVLTCVYPRSLVSTGVPLH